MFDDLIKKYALQFSYLSEQDIIDFIGLSKLKHYPSGYILTNLNEINHNLYFVRKGMVRVYHLNTNGAEKTVHLSWEGSFTVSLESVLNNVPSPYIVETSEPCELFVANYEKVQKFIEERPQFQKANKFFLQQIMMHFRERIDSFVCLSPEERYLELIEKQPEIFNRLANKHIASYLGITPVSLSRIRKRIATR